MSRASIALVWDGDKVLAVTNRKHGGWGFPGGKREGGETPKETAARELFEETGLEADADDLVQLGQARWKDDEVTCFYVAKAKGSRAVQQREDGTVPRWRNFGTMVEESPFEEFYLAMFPDGLAHLLPTRLT